MTGTRTPNITRPGTGTPATVGLALPNSRMRADDVIRAGALGLRTRRLRTGLSVVGIAIGIAAMIGVLGLSSSSQADLETRIQALGTNLLDAQAGQGFGRGDATLPDTAVAMVANIGPVEGVSSVAAVDATVRRTDLVRDDITGGISVYAVDDGLIDTLRLDLVDGAWFNQATSAYPAVVLGSTAAAQLGVTDVSDGLRVYINDQWFAVIGIIKPVSVAEGLDRAALVGLEAAETYLAGGDLAPGTLYIRTTEGSVDAVRGVLPATIDPESPEEVEVSRPSDALAAEEAADDAFTSLFLGLGAVALFVGGIGIANVMVISVIERRGEIGLRRALGATRAHIRRQFLTESVLLAGAGGLVGIGLGVLITAFYARSQGWAIVVPTIAVSGGLIASLVIGAAAGLYPAIRAAHLTPTEALRSQ